jgi:hypothetical protein
MAIAVHGAAALVKRRERRQRQWHRCRSLHIGEMLADLATDGAMDPGVGDGQFLVQQEGILLLQSGQASCLESIALDTQLAVARATTSPAAIITGRSEWWDISIRRDLEAIRAGGRNGWFWRWLGAVGAGGRNGWFWRRSGELEVASDSLAIDV